MRTLTAYVRIDGYICPMPEELTTAVELPFRHRVRHGVRKPHNWLQLIRFAAVGASGYVVNLIVFAVCVHAARDRLQARRGGGVRVSVLNNFWWNRHWTFRAQREAHPVEQAVKFFAISLVAFGFSYVVLVSLVDGAGFAKVVAQAISIAAATPLSFVGQKLWSFRAVGPWPPGRAPGVRHCLPAPLVAICRLRLSAAGGPDAGPAARRDQDDAASRSTSTAASRSRRGIGATTTVTKTVAPARLPGARHLDPNTPPSRLPADRQPRCCALACRRSAGPGRAATAPQGRSLRVHQGGSRPGR